MAEVSWANVAVVTAPKLTVTVPIVLPEEEGFLGNEWLGCGDWSNVIFCIHF
jgi:hypothetical protein